MPQDIYGQLKCGQCGTLVYVDQARYITAGGTPLCDSCYFGIIAPPRDHRWYSPLTEGMVERAVGHRRHRAGSRVLAKPRRGAQ